MADEHPDPTGPETGDGTARAEDGAEKTNVTHLPGNGQNGGSIADRTEEDAGREEPQEPPVPPIQGSRQLTLAGLGRRGLPISSQISIMSKTHPIDGMIGADEEVTLVVRVRVQQYSYTPERNGNEVVGFKHTHSLRIMEVARAGSDHAAVLLASDEGGERAAAA